MRRTATRLVVIVLTGFVLTTDIVTAQGSSAAQRAAETWLSLVDSGSYAESWNSAAAYFKGQVTESAWLASMQGARSPLGSLRSREVANSMSATTLPGAPDGDYWVFQFDASFEQKQSATETVTAVLEQDGEWRITGYFIR